MTRCTTCNRTWTGLAEAHCTSCHRHFTTASAFDLHRVGPTDTRHCTDPTTLTRGDGAPKLTVTPRKSGEVWGYPSGGQTRLGRLPTAPHPATAGPAETDRQ